MQRTILLCLLPLSQAGTNKTNAPTPGLSRPGTPFPTEPDIVIPSPAPINVFDPVTTTDAPTHYGPKMVTIDYTICGEVHGRPCDDNDGGWSDDGHYGKTGKGYGLIDEYVARDDEIYYAKGGKSDWWGDDDCDDDGGYIYESKAGKMGKGGDYYEEDYYYGKAAKTQFYYEGEYEYDGDDAGKWNHHEGGEDGESGQGDSNEYHDADSGEWNEEPHHTSGSHYSIHDKPIEEDLIYFYGDNDKDESDASSVEWNQEPHHTSGSHYSIHGKPIEEDLIYFYGDNDKDESTWYGDEAHHEDHHGSSRRGSSLRKNRSL